MNRLALVVIVVTSSCFRGDFLEGTVCDDDSQCAPHFVCIVDGSTTSGGSSGGPLGVCGSPDASPTSSGSSGTSSGSSGTTTGTTTGVGESTT